MFLFSFNQVRCYRKSLFTRRRFSGDFYCSFIYCYHNISTSAIWTVVARHSNGSEIFLLLLTWIIFSTSVELQNKNSWKKLNRVENAIKWKSKDYSFLMYTFLDSWHWLFLWSVPYIDLKESEIVSHVSRQHCRLFVWHESRDLPRNSQSPQTRVFGNRFMRIFFLLENLNKDTKIC